MSFCRLVFASFVLIGFVAAHGQEVDYRTTGATVAKVIADVSAKTGEKLTVSKELAKEIVVVLVNEVSLDEFKKRLADCVSGKWAEKEGGELELRVDTALSNARRKSAQEAYAKGIPAQIKSSEEMYAQPGIGAIRQDGPDSNKLALAIGERLKESDYEKVLPHGRIVFSTNPNRSQLRLPEISDLVTKYMPAEPSPLITEITFAVERPTSDGFTRYGLCGFDQRGRMLLTSYISLVTFEKGRPPVLTGTPIKWSPVSQELAKQFRTWSYRATNGLLNIPDFLRAASSKPTEIDPISYGFGEGILAVAQEKQENVIACIADDNVVSAFSMGYPGMTTGEFWHQVQNRSALVSERSNGWISVRPTDPVGARELRGDRVALEKLIGSATGLVWPRLEDLAEFAASNLNCQDIPHAFMLPFHILINDYGTSKSSYESNLRPLQFYACLSQSERAKLRSGDVLPAAALGPKAKEVLNSIIFDPNGVVLGFSVDGEPTELMPLGLSNDLLLSAKVTQSVVVAPLPDAGEPSMPPRAMSARDIAQSRWSRKYDDNPYAREIPELSRVRLGSRLEWDVTMTLSGKRLGSISLADDSVPKESKPTNMEAVPQNVKDVLDKAYQAYLKEMGGG